MKEVTRIHIAKTVYNVEVEAKKELEKYMKDLERYANDAEILTDIEIRITELLAERGVQKDGIITMGDVVAIRKQLGEPKDFAEDGEVVVTEEVEVKSRKRLYRDYDNAVLGGVLSGFAQYIGVDSIWIRLLFIVLLFVSFGTASLIYLILWLLLPPAKTAAEKLEMTGEKVTLEAIKQKGNKVNESLTSKRTADTVQRLLTFCLGLFFSIMALGALIATIMSVAVAIFNMVPTESFGGIWFVWLAFGLFVLSGLLLAALNIVLAITSFKRVWTKRIGIAIVAITIGGILTFSTGVGTFLYGQWHSEETVRQSMTTTNKQLSSEFKDTKELTINTNEGPRFGNYPVVYTVTNEKPHVEFVYQKDTQTPQVNIKQDGDKTTIDLNIEDNWRKRGDIPVHIYGPALSELTVTHGDVRYETDNQQNMTFIATNHGSITVSGTFELVKASVDKNGEIELDSATVNNLEASANNGEVSTGVVKNLNVAQPDSCPDRDNTENSVEVANVTGEFIYNGEKQSPGNLENPCGIVKFNSKEDK